MTGEGQSFVGRLQAGDAWHGAPREPWAPWARRALAAFAVGLLVCAATVAAVNPRAEFPWRLYRPVVDDYPADKLAVYRQHGPVTGTLVLGSSRSLALPPLPSEAGLAGFNFAIPAGSLSDARLVHAYVTASGGTPAVVLIGLDLTQLAEGRQLTGQVRGSSAAEVYTGESRSLPEWGEALAGTVDRGYLDDTVRVLRLTHVDGYPPPFRTFDGDGVEQLPRREASIAAGRYDLDARIEQHWSDTIEAQFGDGRQPQAAAFAPLARLVEGAAQEGSLVKVFLTPFHPTVLERLEGQPVFEDFRSAALRWAGELCGPRVELFDYTDPSSFGGSPTEFYDGYHMTRENGRRAVQGMMAGEGQRCPEAA